MEKIHIPKVFQASATNLPYPDNPFDAVITDPPYYDNMPYFYLSDFFYVWLKRTIGDLYPDLFATPLTPKSEEIVVIAHTSARTEHYADIGVFTLKEWRGRGFATAAASIVAKRVQEVGQIPLWSTGEDNIASLRIAQKLGFTEVSRSTYVIPEKDT